MDGVKVIGIDPGKQGAVAVVGAGGELLQTWRTPLIGKEYDLQLMLKIISDAKGLGARSAAIERPVYKSGASSTTMVGIGFGHGLWHMAVAANRIGFEIVTPTVWQRCIPGKEDRNGRRFKGAGLKMVWKAEAARRWPNIGVHSGICDAALIAEYYRRVLVGDRIDRQEARR